MDNIYNEISKLQLAMIVVKRARTKKVFVTFSLYTFVTLIINYTRYEILGQVVTSTYTHIHTYRNANGVIYAVWQLIIIDHSKRIYVMKKQATLSNDLMNTILNCTVAKSSCDNFILYLCVYHFFGQVWVILLYILHPSDPKCKTYLPNLIIRLRMLVE